ncbi:M3 family metallopeptidase [Chryseolinea soli]|uniref:M3 family peptidase n=1 Tax=Chryseolinea soli TaxID=2321403 RepID=A0A385SZZ0_9BACT|nr:M3 family metallopeptidase [Chryseolinea soli]AYB35675.1 M3 family peptidase [Chryseolinea soli]
MRHHYRISLLLLFAATLFSCSKPQKETPVASDDNPLLKAWEGPYGGLPPFDKVEHKHFIPAFEAATAANLADIDKITAQTAAPDFDNTILALEQAGKPFSRLQTFLNIWANNMNDSSFQKIESELTPRLAAFNDQIIQNGKLFARIKTVYESEALKSLTPEQQRLTWLYYTNFVHSGAQLDSTAKQRLSDINQKLAALFTKFSQHVLADENDQYVTISKKEDLAGLPQSLIDGAAATAADKKQENVWLISNTRSSVDPFLTFSTNRELREKVWRMFINRGDNGNANDNNAIITDILQLRAERAKLLGFKTHAHLMLDNKMAKTPERAMELMEEVWKPAVARVKVEVADMQAIAQKEGANIKIAPWDYRFYAEKVRKQRYDLDQNEVKPYMQLDKMREGMFWAAGELFGFTFTPLDSVPVYHPDVKVWEVKDKTSGRTVGVWYFDPYARPGKRSGAWMNTYRNQHKLDGGMLPMVSNNSNFIKGKPGEPVLISLDDATTLFHEFGHALHGLSSDVTYPSLQSPNVASDYVEFPSQLNERWFLTPEVLNTFALHYQTGKPIPKELVDKIRKTKSFNSGFTTVEYLASALIDMKLHLEGDKKIDPDQYERETLTALGMPAEIVMRHRTPQFLHIFADDGYSAGYYSYLWSDVISADAFTAFTEAGGPYDKTVSDRYKQHVLSVGNTIDPAEGYKQFRGRDPKINALMEVRGFAKPK